VGKSSSLPGDIAALLTRLGSWLGKHRKRYSDGLLPGATPADLDQLQAVLKLPVPDGLRAWLSWHNGQQAAFIGHFQQDWDLLGINQILEAKKDLDSSEGTGWQKNWIPFLGDDADDYVCVDSSQPGAPVREFWQGKTDQPVVAPTLAAWLADFVTAVERGDYREDSERGSFLRRSS
jgi:cell wall assembly regulator SMI1